MAKRRRLKGKRLLVASVSFGASTLLSACQTVANLVAPPEDAMVEEDAGGGASDAGGVDAGESRMDAGDNMDAGSGMDAGDGVDAGDDAGAEDAGSVGPRDSSVIFLPDAPIANLVAPPDGFF